MEDPPACHTGKKDFSTNKCIFGRSALMPNRDKNDKQDEKVQTTIARHRQTGIESCPQHQLRSFAICLPSRRNADYFCNLQTFILCVALSGMCFFFRQQRYKHKVGGGGGGAEGSSVLIKQQRRRRKKREGRRKKKEKKNQLCFFSLLSQKLWMHFSGTIYCPRRTPPEVERADK